MTAPAVAAAVAVAARHGVRVTAPVVLHDGSNTLVHLRPAPLVARVATTTAAVRPGDAWLSREVVVAGMLAAAGAPVVAPAASVPPGPHPHGGLALTLWRHEDERPGRLEDQRPAGAALRECHRLLLAAAPALPPPPETVIDEACRLVTGPLRDHFTPEEVRTTGWWARRLPVAIAGLTRRRQPLHGDAHLGNVLHTARGPLWNDWEDTFSGPREWDLACAVANARVFDRDVPGVDAFLEGYGSEGLDERLLDTLVDARVLQAVVWGTLQTRERGQARSPVVSAALQWLSQRRS